MSRLRVHVVTLAFAVAACGTQSAQQPPQSRTPSVASTVRVYTSVTQDTVDAVVAAFNDAHPDTDVEVFRAPTGELSARIAAEQREGGIKADVLWLSDPLSMEQYERQGLLAPVPQAATAAVDEQLRSDTYVATRILNMVVVHSTDLADPPAAWTDLTDPAYAQAVAVPDPSFAGSALGALGYFALSSDAGIDFYRDLAANGAVQVQTPDDVTTGVAEGQYAAGMTLDNSARTAADKGSPVELVAPEPGAIAITSPAAVVAGSDNEQAAAGFVEFIVTEPAQQAIADTGWEPVIDGVDWPHELPQVFPDWDAIAEDADGLLQQYRDAFAG